MRKGVSIYAIIKNAEQLHEIRKTDVHPGDVLIINTRNSLYRIDVLGTGMYSISGGWFDSKGLSPFTTTIAGCTWGGSSIKTDSIAACGLHIEFGNMVTTSIVERIIVFKKYMLN